MGRLAGRKFLEVVGGGEHDQIFKLKIFLNNKNIIMKNQSSKNLFLGV